MPPTLKITLLKLYNFKQYYFIIVYFTTIYSIFQLKINKKTPNIWRLIITINFRVFSVDDVTRRRNGCS